MRNLLVGVAVLCLLAAGCAPPPVAGDLRTNARVVSVDLNAKSIVFTYSIDKKASKSKATWNERTNWLDETAGRMDFKRMTADLAESFKEGTKIRVATTNGVFTLVALRSPDDED